MKMEVQVSSPVAGTVQEMCVAVGDHVASGQTLASIA
jgi:biotin carboxyl carrier protein